MKKFLGIVCLSLLLYCNAYSDIINEIKELNILFKEGYLTKEEFSKAKKILIGFEEEAPKKIIEEENYYELLYRPNDDKIDEWKKFKKSSSDYNVWVEIRRDGDNDYSFSWRGKSTRIGALKNAFDACNKRVKDRPKRDFRKSDLCIPIFVNFYPGKARKTTYEEKIKYTEEYYGKEKSNKFFKKNPWSSE